VIAFQYNPAVLTRHIQPQYFGADEGGRTQALRFAGPPIQQISVEVEVDAADQLEWDNSTAKQYGILPELAALEKLLYPSLDDLSSAATLAASGTLEIAPIDAPLTLFSWGANRVLPVRVESFRVSEQLFDTNLNPIQATVALDMRVLSSADLDPSSTGYSLFTAYQQGLEAMATEIDAFRAPKMSLPAPDVPAWDLDSSATS
jgi:hypothetical protein